ncbi:hypothetical protein HNQ93_000437 [Hymenobacter luteus]|uniref:Uncharacterized protein n=2 Tax=Hymenobacter TaxID=89966 RepID=A0A7W9WBG2_9BACT|nr:MULTISPECIES: hypothetical protein [Hymenobacter]MBB4600083.1 hypothetical protein [Hymenobacter latericoloratus]MBB6057607.1 hypothetical protein [Hymenobacter luteus]
MKRFFGLGLVLAAFCAPLAVRAQLYDARTSSVNYDKHERDAVKVQVEGTAQWTRDFWQAWLKDTYNIKLKGSGVFGVGKKDVLEARQVPMSSVTGKLLDLYSTVTSPADTVSELSVWAGVGPDSFLSASGTPSEFSSLRTITQNFAAAARLKAYREQIAEAEKQLATAEKDKEKLEKERASLAANTKANLEKIEQLKKQNADNKLKAAEDSVKLLDNARLTELRKAQVERRRARLTNLDRK